MIRLPLCLVLAAAPCFAQVNIAPAGIPTQSSNWSAGTIAAHATDGNRNGSYWLNETSITLSDFNAWWQVDFQGEVFPMSEVRIFPRTDCCSLRNTNIHVAVLLGATEVWSTNLYTTQGSGTLNPNGEYLTLPPGTVGDRVRVQYNGYSLEGTGYLSLGEVEVISVAAPSTPFCGPATPNSSGQSAEILAFGTNAPGGAFGLIASGLPSNRFGYFLVGAGTASFVPPGSQGNLCIAGGVLGRYNQPSQIRFSQFAGDSIGLVVDTMRLPFPPFAPILAGQTWNFQAWFRDGATSNFTNAVSVTF